MKSIVALVIIVIAFPALAQMPGKPPAKPTGKAALPVPVNPRPQVSREKALEYLKLTRRTDVMERAYRARFVVKATRPVSEVLIQKHLAAINTLMVNLVQKSFSPLAMDSVLVFLKTPGGERWSEDAADFNDEFRDEITEAWNQFDEEIKDANEAAADAATR